MKIRLKGEYAIAYVQELGGSLTVHVPDETCKQVYFDAESVHPDHLAIVEKLFHSHDLQHLFKVKARVLR